MSNFFDKDNYGKDDIEFLIENSIEESINLDFKAAGALDKKKKKEISKDVSSFANSDGGIIIYGIEEKEHRAFRHSFVDGNIYTKEWIEQVINSSISKRISGIRIYPIRFDGNIVNSIYIVKIPQSNQAPHMAIDNKYYKRYNFESVPMEEYEVRNLFMTIRKAEIEILNPEINLVEKLRSGQHIMLYNCLVKIRIKNISTSIDTLYKLVLDIPRLLMENPKTNNTEEFNQYFNRREGNSFIYTINSKEPLFQNEAIQVVDFSFAINNRILDQVLEDQIKIQLFYSAGIKEKIIDLKEICRDLIN